MKAPILYLAILYLSLLTLAGTGTLRGAPEEEPRRANSLAEGRRTESRIPVRNDPFRGTIVYSAIIVAAAVAAIGYARWRRRRKTLQALVPVATFDPARYMGRWFEIARYDRRFERGLHRVEARYELLSDGGIAVVNSGIDARTGIRRTARGRAHLTATPGLLRVSFFWIFYADYRVLALDDDYRWALVGGASRSYLWILSRTPELEAATLERIRAAAQARGYDTARLTYIAQDAARSAETPIKG